jgi:hypothetical protein
MPSVIANAIGLATAGQSWSGRTVAVPDKSSPGLHHGFSVNAGSDQDIVFIRRRDQDYVRAFRSNRDGKVVEAVVFDLHMRQTTVLTNIEAQKELNAEFAFWAATLATRPVARP